MCDFRAEPPWQRDGIVLLCYVGVEDLLRVSATGVKQTLGFDLAQLNADLGGAVLVASLWVAAAMATGVVGEQRYAYGRVFVTWLLAAPTAALLRFLLISGEFPFSSPEYLVTDVVATLALQLGLRLAEEQGLV